MSYNTQEMSEIRVTSKIDRTALTETLSKGFVILYPRVLSLISDRGCVAKVVEL